MKTKLTLIFSAVLTISLFTIVSCEGPEGLTGHQDTRGEQGPSGPVGPAGEGTTMHAGEGEPANSTGEVGDYYLDLTSGNLFGPKPAEGWGEPVHLHGPQGPAGTTDHGILSGLKDDHLQYLLADGVRDATDGFSVTVHSRMASFLLKTPAHG